MNNKEFFINNVDACELTLEEKKPSKFGVLYEDTSKREKNAKHFRLKNGNYMAVIYDHPVHKLDSKTGRYVNIAPEVSETDTDYETSLNNFRVRMPKSYEKDRFVTVEKDGREISWKYIPRNTSFRKKDISTFATAPRQEPWDTDDITSIKYKKADADTDIQYDISNNGVKESIILFKDPEIKTFSFELKLKGLKPILDGDSKSVFLVHDNEDIGSEPPEIKIPPAFMEDANHAFCDNLHYEIRTTNNATFLDLVLDSDWLSDPERAYPVVIDPRVEISDSSENSLKMVELCSNSSVVSANNTNIGRRIGVDPSGNIHRLYIGFSLPTLAEGFRITKAGLLLHQKLYSSYNTAASDYTVAPVVDPYGKDLSVDSFTWANVQNLIIAPAIDTFKGDYRPSGAELEIDMTAIMEDWYDSSAPSSNKKCVVIKKNSEEDCCSTCVCPNYLDVYSIHASNNYKPQMYIEYTSSDLYADNQKYHTFEIGRAGTGSINLFTGKMSFAHGDVTAEGVKLPLSISHLYRHEYVNELTSSANKYGKGWKLSVEQTLQILNDHNIKAIYTNAQGKRHYFMYNEDAPNEKIVDDAGLGLTYTEGPICIAGQATTHILTDEKGNKMIFNSSGKLIQLIDANSIESSLTYANGNLIRVVDGTNHTAQLKYDSQNKLTSIVDNGDDARTILYEYNASGELISITYPSASSAYANEGTLKTEFVYGENSRLEQIIDYSGISYSIEYDSYGRVQKLSSSGSRIVADNSVSLGNTVYDDAIRFEYYARSTAIINCRTNIKTVYKFDENGRETSSYQDMTNVVDTSKISESTVAELSGYKPFVNNRPTVLLRKYRALNVSLNNDSADENNLIQNGSFNASSTPMGWSTVGGGSIISESYIPGGKSYRITNSGNAKYLTQTVDISNQQFDRNVLVVSAWAKASDNVNTTSNNSSAKFRLCLSVTYETEETEDYFEDYDSGNKGWQYAAIPFVLNKQNQPIGITVKLDYTDNTGTCYFTNVRLFEADGISTTNEYMIDDSPITKIRVFDEDRNIKTLSTKRDSDITTVEYIDTNSDVVCTAITDKNAQRYVNYYKYDDRHNLIKAQDHRGLVIEYTYNSSGKELTRKTYHKDNASNYMFSEHTYTADSFIKSESDPRYMLNGEKLKTSYQHDTSRNLLLKQTSVNGQEYNYTYDDTSDDLMSLSSVTNNKTNENQFFYTLGYLTRVAHNEFNFGFSFDQLGRSKSVTVGDGAVSTTLLNMSYEKDGANDIVQSTYASGEKNTVTFDIFGNPSTSTYTDNSNTTRIISNATYDSVGKLKQLVDNERGVCYNFTYDAKGNVTKIVESDTNGNILSTNTFVFATNGQLSSKTYGAIGQTYRPVYEKNANGYAYPENEVVGITLDGKFTDEITKDELRRASTRTFKVGSIIRFSESYGYLSTPKDGKTITTEIISSVESHVYGTSANSSTFHYTYDKAGNLETISNGTSLLSKYYYDGLNRLKREDNHAAGKTYVWDYDVGGNILYKKEYALCTDANLGTCLDTKTYTYKSEGWRDRLDSFDGQICTYDLMGNPLTYRGNALTWTKVRRLASFGSNTFAYGANGIRYRKNNTVYTLDGNKILRESDGTKTLTYYHGGSGIVGFAYNGVDYYFRKNLQGDVTEIYSYAGLKVASYVYDAWGKVLSVNNYTNDNIGDINPIRYRSYYYDVETGLYYLNSRYYDPELGRFINADTTDILENAKYDINGLNLYAYCDNNPVSGRDDEGDMSFWKKLAAAVAVVAVVAVVAAATAASGGALCAAATVLMGAAKGALIGAVSGAVTGAVVGGVQGAVEGYQETGTLEGTLRGMGKGALNGMVDGATDGLVSGMVTGGLSYGISSMSGNPMFCFVAGTTVLSTLGKKAIETIQVGDTVPCIDHITGETAEKRVITTTVNKVNRLIELDIDGEIIQCTETHPFQVKGRGWVNAADLAPNDIVYTKDWNTATVKSVNLLELDEPVEVFNFEVEDCHTYFVGELSILVHNANCGNTGRSGKQARLREIADDDKVSSALRGEIKRDMNQIARGKRKTIRVPQGCHLAHRIGYSAKNGFSYAHSDLQWIADHMRHHHFFGK